ncbi:MAG: metallophosphoesterase [Deltaproteobacteria bacterium]|nr:metallophosphoesterase [Deltaproteobacteria bacterium]
MMFTRRTFLMGTLAAAPLLTGRRARAAAAPAGATTITLLHTNDTHSRLDPFPGGQGNLSHRGGIARRAHLIRAIRKENPNTLALDGGDTFQGTPFYNKYLGTLDYELMSMAGYDASAVGNHDFDGGVDGLVKAAALAKFDLLASYDVKQGALNKVVKSSVIRTVGGLKVGLFGLSVVLDGLVNPRLCQGVRYQDPVEAARRQTDELRNAGCDLVIALSHLGHTGYLGEPGDLHWPQKVAGVDYVVGGHTHTFLEKPERVKGPGGWETAVMQVGFAGVSLGRADITFQGRNRVELAGLALDVRAV